MRRKAKPSDPDPSSRLSAARHLEVAVLVDDRRWQDGGDSLAALAETAACAALEPELDGPAEVSILLAGDELVHQLNREWRGIDRPTNVLSFPASAARGPGPRPLGDVVLAYETVAAEAVASGLSLSDHLAHLVVHGALHLLGHDHEDEDEAGRMESREIAVLAGLGIADPYARAETETGSAP